MSHECYTKTFHSIWYISALGILYNDDTNRKRPHSAEPGPDLPSRYLTSLHCIAEFHNTRHIRHRPLSNDTLCICIVKITSTISIADRDSVTLPKYLIVAQVLLAYRSYLKLDCGSSHTSKDPQIRN